MMRIKDQIDFQCCWARATLLVAALLSCSPAMAGGATSGGGSGAAAEFADLGANAATAIRRLPTFPVRSDVFQNVVNSTHVEFVNNGLRDPQGREVDALNFPQRGLIQVNLSRWMQLLLAPVQKYQLVVHEYLGILRVDDSGYHVSRIILDGGVVVNSLVCSIPVSNTIRGIISWYTLDVSGTGTDEESVAKFAMQSVDGTFDTSDPVTIGLSARQDKPYEPGYALSWSAVALETAYISYAQLTTPGSFTTNFFSDNGFASSSGMPTFILKGQMSCRVQKNR